MEPRQGRYRSIRGRLAAGAAVCVVAGALFLGAFPGGDVAEAHNQSLYGPYCGYTSYPPVEIFLRDVWDTIPLNPDWLKYYHIWQLEYTPGEVFVISVYCGVVYSPRV